MGTHEPTAPPGHSLSFEQIWKVAQLAMQEDPVKPETKGKAGMPPSPQLGWAACISMVPVPQHTVPVCDAQSGVPSHTQSVDIATGQLVAAGSHVDGEPEVSGVSQQCCPAAQVTFEPPAGALKGQ